MKLTEHRTMTETAHTGSPRLLRWGALALLPLGLLVACSDDTAEDGQGGSAAGIPGFTIEPSAGGIRRLTTSQLKYSVEYLLGPDAATLVDVWVDPQLHGFESIGAAELSLGSNDVSTLETVTYQMIDVAIADPTSMAAITPCVMQNPQAACYDAVANDFARVAWRRPLEADEKARLIAIAQAGQAWGAGDFDTGLRYQLSAILQSPNFVYISEVGEQDGQHRKLTGYELASRMSFFLLHQIPDVELLDAAANGSLTTNDGIRAQAQRLITLPQARRSIDRFYSELFLLRDLTNLSKDQTKYPEWNGSVARSMQEESLRFLQDIIWSRNADARELFTSRETFVDANLAEVYGVASPGGGWSKVSLPPEQLRSGLLAKSGFLTRFAHPGLTSPTRRGRFFWEKLMCEDIPAPPPGVDTTLPPDPVGSHQTMKQKLEVHMLNPSCTNCHIRMDTIGLTMEHFDAMGRYRETDEGLSIETANTYGNWEFSSIDDIGALIAEDERATACIVRNIFRQSMGHLETEGEAMSLALLDEGFKAGGYKIQDLLVELCANPAFTLVGEPK